MTLAEFASQLRANQARAAALAGEMAAAPDGRREALLREYVRCKFFLPDDAPDSDDLFALADAGTARLAGLRRDGLELPDKSAGCTSVASSVTKKALLVLALGRALGVRFDPDEAAAATTVPALSALIGRALAEK